MDARARPFRAVDQVAGAFLRRSWPWRYALAAGAVVLAGLARQGLAGSLGDRSPFQTFVLAALVSAIAGGLGPGLFATLLGALVVAYLYMPPSPGLAVDTTADLIRLVLFLMEGVLSAVAGEALHRALRREQGLARRLGRLGRLLSASSPERPSATPPTLVEPLTDRELEVVSLLMAGLRNDEIATRLFVSRNTVKTHLAHVYGKLGVRSRTEAVARSLELGLFADRPATDGARGSSAPVSGVHSPT
jgi:DNA-binding CsgD family transcriptional regulator